MIEVSLRFKFPTTNNQVEYEEVIAGVSLVEEIWEECLKLITNSQLVVSQIRGEA